MNTLARLLPAAVLCLASAPGPALQEDDPVYVDEIKKEFLEKIERCRAASDWKGLFDLQAQAALPRNIHKLVRLPGVEARYVGLIEHLNLKFVELPPEALRYYRGQFDGAARREFDRARAAGDPEGLERVVSTWFYSSRTDEALDLLANLHVEEGRLDLAIHCWSRLLHHYPDSEIPREVTAARLAGAAAASGLDSVVQNVRSHARERRLTGSVIVGDRPVPLEEFLDSLKIEASPSPAASAPREPSVAVPDRSATLSLTAVRPEIRRWGADLTGRPDATPRGRAPAPSTDLPYLPAYARVDGHEMVVYTNGLLVTAIDPARANALRPDEGIYFKYPPPGEQLTRAQLPQDNWRGQGVVAWMRPYIGVTIDGEHAFATLYSGKRSKEAPAPGMFGMADTLFGMMRLVCLNLRTQQLLWDTDFGEPGNQLRKMEFWDKNFAFSGPPLVVGDRVYAGIGTSPMGEEESRVLCFDRRTGSLLWDRFLASVSMNARAMGAGSFTSRLTVLAEDRGALIAHANIGVIASLDAVTGHVRWLSRYPRSSAGTNPWGAAQIFARPGSPMVVFRGTIYALPQDAHELLVVDAATGTKRDAPKLDDLLGGPKWRDAQRLIGRMGDYLVLGMSGGNNVDSCILNTGTGDFLGLTSTNTLGMGRGSIDGETLYLPTIDKGKGGMAIIHGLRQWRHFEKSVLWWPLGEPANVIRGGNYLISTSSSRISIFTDSELVREEYRRRLEQSPPNPAAWLEYGMLMHGNERWAEAGRAYLNFIDAVQGDTEWIGRAREVRTELHGIFLNRGREELQRNQGAEAAAHFGRARDFAWDSATLTEATRLLAAACEDVSQRHPSASERKRWARTAVEEYQELIRRAPPGFIAPNSGTVWVPIRRFASSRIGELLKAHGAEAYEGVAKAAGEELKKAGRNPAALQAMADLYPDGAASIEALERISEMSATRENWASVASTLRELRSRLDERWTPAHQKRLHEAIEKTGDAERLELELARMERQFEGAARLGPDEQSPTVAEYLAKAKAAAAALPHRKPDPQPGAPATLSTWEPAKDRPGTAWGLLVPGGLEPAAWPADHEFFTRGSSIELWNIKSKKLLWSAAHPGTWTGIVYADAANAAREVRVVEVQPDSPGSRAGLVPGDVIRSVDGAPVSGEDFDLATETKSPGTKLAIVYRRGNESLRTDVTTAPWPASPRPAVVGALFTADGSLAVAWEDLVASLDAADGKVRWISRPGRDRFVIRAIHAAADRILAHEQFMYDRCRSALRTPPREGARAAPPAEDQHSRVFGLDESDGEPLYALALRFDPNMVAHHSVQFLGRPLDSHAGLVVTGILNSLKSTELLPLSVEEGREGTRIQLSGPQQGSAWIVEPGSGTLWLVDGRRLRSFTLPDYARGLDFSLEGHVDPMASGYGLSATEERVAVVSIGQNLAPPRFAVFSAKDGSLVASHKPVDGPLRDRVMPTFRGGQPERKLMAGLITLAPDGLVILYNESRSGGGAGGARRASLSALSVSGDSFKLEWDAVTPTLTAVAMAERELLGVRSGPKGYYVTTFRGIAPGKQEESAIVAFHSRKDEGAVRKLYDDLVLPIDAFGQRKDPAPMHRGRIFLNRKGGLEVLGD